MDEVDGCCTRRVLDCTRNVRCRRSVTIWRSQIVAGWPWERCQSRTLGILSQMLLYTLKEEQLWQRFSLAINIVCLFSPDSRLKQNLIDRKNWFVFRAHSGYSVRSDSGLFMALQCQARQGKWRHNDLNMLLRKVRLRTFYGPARQGKWRHNDLNISLFVRLVNTIFWKQTNWVWCQLS